MKIQISEAQIIIIRKLFALHALEDLTFTNPIKDTNRMKWNKVKIK